MLTWQPKLKRMAPKSWIVVIAGQQSAECDFVLQQGPLLYQCQFPLNVHSPIGMCTVSIEFNVEIVSKADGLVLGER